MRLRRGRVAGSDRQLLCNVIPVDISDQRSVAVRRDKAGLGLTPGSPAAPRVFIHLHPAPVLARRGFRSGCSQLSLGQVQRHAVV